MSPRNADSASDNVFENPAPRRSKTRTNRNGQPKRRRWPLILLALGLVAYFLPNMIGWFGLQQPVVNYAMSDFQGKVSVEKASLGWFQPIRLTNVVATDPSGDTLFQASHIASNRSLYSLATSNDYGQFEIANPEAFIQLRPDGSNLEDALATYLAAPEKPAELKLEPTTAWLPKLNLNVSNGKATISTNDSAQTWQIDELNSIIKVGAAEGPVLIDAQCRVTPIDSGGQAAPQANGTLQLTAQIDQGQTELKFNTADVLLKSQDVPMSLAAPILQRFIGPTRSTGTLNGNVQAAYDGPTQSVTLDIQQARLVNFAIQAPELIGPDQISIEDLTAQGIVQVSSKLIAAQQFKVKSEIGKITADGSFDVNQLAHLASQGRLLDTPFQLDGEVDLAKLVRMFPATLQLHQDLVLESGVVTFQAGSQNENGTRRMVVNLDTAHIKARRGQQTIDWANPLRLVATIRESQGQLELDDVRCESDFLTIEGHGNHKTGAFAVKGDLDLLMRRVRQFADLGETTMAGVLDGGFGWQLDTSAAAQVTSQPSLRPIQIVGSFTVTNPAIKFPGMPHWQQPKMSIKLGASGASNASILRLNKGGIQIDVGQEQLVSNLAGPIANAYTQMGWNTQCTMTGTMAGWLGHVQNFIDLGDVKMQGTIALTCDAAWDANRLEFTHIRYEIDQLGFEGYAMKIREPKATGDGRVLYDLTSGNVTIPETTITSGFNSARGRNIKVTFPSNMQVHGDVDFRADVNRLATWFELSPTPGNLPNGNLGNSSAPLTDGILWYGSMDGTVKLTSDENGIIGRVNSTITELVAGHQVEIPAAQRGQLIQAGQANRKWQEVFSEAKLGLTGDVALANDFNAVRFQNATLDSPSLQATVNGTIEDLGGSMLADLQGTWRPSWEKINSLLAAYTGNALRFAGQGEDQFVLKGPLFETNLQPGSPEPWVALAMQAAASFGWERGEILGLPVGQSQMNLNLDRGIAKLQSNGIPFAGGVVQLAPQIDLRGEAPVLLMEQSRIIDNVALQPETARQWLKYVAPLVADATSARGNFTVDINRAKIPLFEPAKMELQGSVQLTQVVIGAGPTAEQLLGTVKQIRALLKPGSSDRDLNTWLQMSEQTVPIQVKNGRVYHDRVKLAHKDVVIQTSGSVGFDQTLNLVAEIPIADDWIAGNKYLAGLKGKAISVPIGGTVSKPILDKRAVQRLSADLVKQAAGGVINDKLNAERDKIFGKLGEKLGLPTGQPGSQQPGLQDQLQNKAQEELLKGIGNLFGK